MDKEAVVHAYHGRLFSHSKKEKNETMQSAATGMDIMIIILNKVSQTEKDKYDVTYMWNLKRKKDTN